MASSYRILVVDDEPDLLGLVAMYLESWNFEVKGFTSPIEALVYFQKNPSFFSLVLTDIRMPGMSGLELVNHVLKIRPQVKVMLMTAFEIRMLELESCLPVVKHKDILKKPFRFKEICECVKNSYRWLLTDSS